MNILKSLLIFLFIQSIHTIADTSSSLNDCGDPLVSYSQEDINVAIELSYEKGSVKEVVESLEIPYPKILHWIYERERKLAEEKGHHVRGSSSTAFLSSIYIVGVTDFALQVGINEAARQLDINRRTLIRLVDRVKRVIKEARQAGHTVEDYSVEALEAILVSEG